MPTRAMCEYDAARNENPNVARFDRNLLDSLSQMPFIDSAELAGVLGEPHATVHRALTDLLADRIVGRVSHGTAQLPLSQRYYLTSKGIGEAAGFLGFETASDFVRSYPISREWLALLIRRMDAVAAVYRIAASLSPGIDRDASELIDVVVSGPDAAAAARDAGVVIRQLFNKAHERVLAVGFAIHQGRSIFQTLADRLVACEALEATLCLDVRREPTSTSRDIHIVRGFTRRFIENEWPGTRVPRLYYDPRSLAPVGTMSSALHAKI